MQTLPMQFDNYHIRLLNYDDSEKFYRLIDENRPRLEAFFSGTVARTRTFPDAQQYLDEILIKAENKLYFPYIIEEISTGEFAGFLDIKNIDWNIPKAELGCFSDLKYEGKGITSKAFSLFVDHCFRHYHFNKVYLRTHEKNTYARRLAEKNGFEKEGILRRDYKTTSGELADLFYYGKLSEIIYHD